MLFAPTPFTSRATRWIVTCLLAVVLPVQGAAIGVFAAKGPAHVHQPTRAAPLVLEDFRRWRPASVAQAHVFAADSVVQTGTGGADADEALGAHALSVLALIPNVDKRALPWAPGTLSAGPLWALQTGFIEPLDRPPRRV
jgi:hypothetical protein